MSDDAIRVTNLEYQYEGAHIGVFQGLDLRIPKGSVYGLLGRNGSGKTTLAKIWLGMLRPGGGQCEVLGLDPLSQAIEIRSRMGYVPQDCDFDPQMTIEQTLDFIRPYYPDRWNDETVQTNLSRFGLDYRKRQTIGGLSGGLKQRLSLVVALAFDPEMVLLDEPTAGLDAVIRREFMETVIEYMTGEGRTVVLSSHLLHDVDRLADHIGIIEQGKMLLDSPIEDLKQNVTRLSCQIDSEEKLVSLPGLIRQRSHGDRYHLATWTHSEEDEQQLRDQLNEIGAREIAVLESSLESIFVDLLWEDQDALT